MSREGRTLWLPMHCLLQGLKENFMLRDFSVSVGHECHCQDVCRVTDRQNQIPLMAASFCSGCASVFSFCFQGFYPVEETVCLGLQKRKLLGRDSITLPALIKQRELELPHHASSLYLFMLQSHHKVNFSASRILGAIVLSMVHNCQFIKVLLSSRSRVHVFLHTGRHELWICSRLSCFLSGNRQNLQQPTPVL